MVKKLTKQTVDSLGAVEAFVWDSSLVGFGLRVRASGRKTYLVKYGGGRRRLTRWLTIGEHGGPWVRNGQPCTLTLDLARDEARRLLGEKAAGNDPAAKREFARGMPTLEEFSERYLKEHARPHKKASSVDLDERNLRLDILPALGGLRLDRISRSDITRFHLARKAKPVAANRCLTLLSHMLTMAEKWGLRPDGSNPCRLVDRFKEGKRERYLSPVELARLAPALKAMEREQPYAVAAVRLLVFLGARVSEILTLRWEHVDLKGRVLNLPDSKTGAKTIHLNAPAVELLSDLPKLSGNPWVIAGRKPGEHLVGLAHVWMGTPERKVKGREKLHPAKLGIRQVAGLEGVRLHDLRHSFASIAVGGGASLPLIGGLLGHASPQTTSRYAHLASDPLKAVAERAGRTIVAAMRGRKADVKTMGLRRK